MKAFDFDINEVGRIVSTVEKLMKAEYMGNIEKELADEIDGADAFVFLAGWHLGGIIMTADTRNIRGAVELSLFAYEVAKKILSENPDMELDEALVMLFEALTEKMKGDIEECDCPKCRAERETKEAE